MSLDTRVEHPGQRCYVLKLHRDADPARGDVRGRVEHLASGHHVNFDDLAGLLAALASDLAPDVRATLGGDRPEPR